MFTKILYSATYVGPTWYGPREPWYLLVVPMLWVLYSMQVHESHSDTCIFVLIREAR